MKKENIFTFTVLLSLFLIPGCGGLTSVTKESITIKDSLALHESCIIAGRIFDDKTNEPIRGANIVVYSKPTRAVSDLYGQFEIIDLIPGKYMLQVFCVGYFQKDIENIEVKPNRLIRIDIKLEPRPE